jgi:tape measure domain-containing protein
MADILASVSVVLGAEISGFRAAMANARKELSGLVKFSEGLKDVGTSLTQYVSAPLALLGGVSVAAAGKLEGLKNGLAAIAQQDLAKQGVTGLGAMSEAARDATERIKVLEQIAKAPGLGLETAEQADIRLRAVGTSAPQAAKEIREFANAIATSGGSRTQFETVTTQLAQLTAKGKVLAQDLRPIIEAAPAVAAALQRLYGTVDSETISASLAKQGKNSADFVADLTDELAKLPRVTGGLKAVYENDLDALLVASAKLGDGIAKAFNLQVVGERFGAFITNLGNSFAGLSPATQGLIVGLAGIAAAVGPVLVAMGTLGAALPAITAGFSVLGVSSLAALGPLVPAALAVGAAAYLIYENFGALSAYFQGEGGALFSDLAASASSAASAIGEAFSTLRANMGSNLGDMVSAATIFRSTFREAAVGVSSVLNVLAGTISGLTNLLTGDFSQAAAGASQAFYGLIDPIANLLGFTVRAQEANPILALRKSATEFNAVFPQLRANLALLNRAAAEAFSDSGEGVDYFGGSIDTVAGKIAKLEERIKALKEAKPALQFDQDIAAANVLIASLEAQLKKLNELGIGSKDMQKALAEVQKSLRTVANESLALGDQYDYLKNRQSATESGIKKLISAGFSPASSAVRGLVADLRNLNNTLGDNTLLKGRSVKGSEKLFETPEFKAENPELDRQLKGKGQFNLPEVLLPNYDSIFSNAAQKIVAGGGAIKAALQPVTEAQLDFNTQMGELSESLSNSVGPLLANFAVQAADAFGSFATGAASLGDAMQGLFGGILQSLASFMSDFGQKLIVIGIGKQSLDLLFTGPQGGPLAIAAGVGLVALAGIASAASKSLSSSLSSSIGSGGRTSSASSPRITNYGQASSQQTIKIEISELRLRGQDLIAIARSQDYRVKLTG